MCSWLTLPFPHQRCVQGAGFQGENGSLLQQPLAQLAFLATFLEKPAAAKLLPAPLSTPKVKGKGAGQAPERGGG